MSIASFEIAGRKIGPEHPPYIVCELSANHNGSLDKALKLIDAAAATGADAIKIQTYTPDTLTIDSPRDEFKIKGGLWDGRRLYDLYKEAFTPFEWHPRLFAHAREIGITLFSTPFDESATDLLASLDAPAYKIASFEAIDPALIAYVARKRRPMIISTGMANLAEIHEAVVTARLNGCAELALLHCTSAYPAPIEAANVRTVPHLGEAFGVVAGLSDHTPGVGAAIASVALGGSIVEKHFTLSRAEGGPDAAFSLEPPEFKSLVEGCKAAYAARGKVDYERGEIEKRSLVFRRSLFVVRDVEAGSVLTPADIRSIRPGYGLPPKHLPQVIGRKAARFLARGQPLAWSDLVA